ncbi:MAG: hypothetical protein J2P18_15245 [Nocardia sp.]|nr:hypothetical protein [Nocardia sp.]
MFAVLMHWKLSIELYPDGVRRPFNFPFITGGDLFVPWDDIESLAVGVFRANAQSSPNPAIDIHLKTPRPPARKIFDTPDRATLPVYAVAAENNTVLAVMRILLSDPRSRQLLARPDAPEWFTAPPLSEQYELSTSAAQLGGSS